MLNRGSGFGARASGMGCESARNRRQAPEPRAPIPDVRGLVDNRGRAS
jgi:hypothetical protein